MTSEPIRDANTDHLLTPTNATFVIIDYQPVQVNSIASMDRQLLVTNIVATAKAAITLGLPIVHSTVNVKTGVNKPPIVADAVGGTSLTAHEMALRRIERTGGNMISVTQLYCELQRDWSRKETIPGFMHLFSLLKHQPPVIS